MKKNRPKQQGSALIPRKDDYPETRKMTESHAGNTAIYDFVSHLVNQGYVIARKNSSTGQLQAMEPWKTAEAEILNFRQVDRLAYLSETSKLRSMYPHLVQTYGVDSDYELPVPELAEPDELPDRRGDSVDDDQMVSVAEAWRMGVFTITPSHSGVRLKMTRCRRVHPDLMPKMTPRGSHTLYRAGDLRVWEEEYTKRCMSSQRGVWFVRPDGTRARDIIDDVVDDLASDGMDYPGPVKTTDALAFLMGKIRGGEQEDVRTEEDRREAEAADQG